MQRTAARQRKASSPPGSPAAVGTRKLRSQSVELGTTSNIHGAQGRRQRQGSANSAASNISASHKPEGNGPKQVHDLTRVQEDPESDPSSDDVESIHDDLDNEESASSSDESSQNKSDVGFQDGHSAAKVHQGSFVQNFNNKEDSKTLKLWKSKAISSKPAPVTSSSRQAQLGPSVIQTKVSDRRHDDSNSNRSPPGSSVEEIHKRWEQETSDKNKENKRPTEAPAKRRLLDRHSAAYKVSFESQEDDSVPVNRKRAFEEEAKRPNREADEAEEDEEDESQDDFQMDTRVMDKSRKSRAPPSQQTSTPHQPKRPRIESNPRSSTDHLQYRQEQDEAPDASLRDSESPDAPPLSTQVKAVAKVNTQRATLSDRKPQTRTPWSENDETLLIDYIEQYGCCWAFIANQPGWEAERPNFQTQLKDKARNMKVAFLKCRLRLPTNFDQVRLGKKEVDIVRRVIHDYDQNIGE